MNHPTPQPYHPAATAQPIANSAKPKRNWFLIAALVVLIGPVVMFMGIILLLTMVSVLGRSADSQFSAVANELNTVSLTSDETADTGTTAKTVASVGINETPRESIDYYGQSFELAFVAKDGQTGVINEYIPVGETLKAWTKMIAVRSHSFDIEPKVMANGIVSELMKMNPKTPYTILPGKDERSCGVDFVVGQPGIAEFNIFIYTRPDDASGMISHQYAERAYGDDISAFADGLDARLKDLRDKASYYEFPALVTSTPAD